MRLVESERNPNRYYLSIAGSVPTDAAARVTKNGFACASNFCRPATKPALPTGNPYFQEGDSLRNGILGGDSDSWNLGLHTDMRS